MKKRIAKRTGLVLLVLLALLSVVIVPVGGASATSSSNVRTLKTKQKCKRHGKKHHCNKGRPRHIVVHVTPPVVQVPPESASPCEALVKNGKLISSSGNCALAVENDTAEPVTVNPCVFVEGNCSVTQVCAKSAWHNADECLLSDYPVANIENLGYELVCVGVNYRRIYPQPALDIQFRASKGSFSGPSEDPEYVGGGLNRTYVCNKTYTPPCPSAEGETDLVWAFVYDIETGLYTEAEAVPIEIPSSEVCAE